MASNIEQIRRDQSLRKYSLNVLLHCMITLYNCVGVEGTSHQVIKLFKYSEEERINPIQLVLLKTNFTIQNHLPNFRVITKF